jgi:hypothetical protein
LSNIAEKLNYAGIGASIAGVLALMSFYGFKTASDVSDVMLATDNRDLFAEIANYSTFAGFGLFGLGLLLSGGSSIARRDELEKKDLILGVGVPALGLLVLLGDFFLF